MHGPVGTDPVVAHVRDGDPSTVLLVRDASGRLHATATACPHLGQPLADGELAADPSGPALECSHHAYRYRLTDGACVAPAPDGVAPLAVHEVREGPDGIRVRLAAVTA